MYPVRTPVQCRLCVWPFRASCIYTHLLRVINCARIGRCDRLGTRIIAACVYLFTLPLPSLSLYHFPSFSLSFRTEVTPSVRIAKRRHCEVAGLYCRYLCMCVYNIIIPLYACRYTMYLRTMRLSACKRCLTNGANTRQYETRMPIIVTDVPKSLRIIFRLFLRLLNRQSVPKKKYTRVYISNNNMSSVCNSDVIQIWVIIHTNIILFLLLCLRKSSKNNHSLRK